MFTRPGTVRFEKGETFCFIMPIQDKPMEAFQPVIRSMNSTPDLRRQSRRLGREAVGVQRPDLQARPRGHRKEAWQRFYIKGEYPEEIRRRGPQPPRQQAPDEVAEAGV
ncbi:DUF6065 family protein [Caulobacter segnis]